MGLFLGRGKPTDYLNILRNQYALEKKMRVKDIKNKAIILEIKKDYTVANRNTANKNLENKFIDEKFLLETEIQILNETIKAQPNSGSYLIQFIIFYTSVLLALTKLSNILVPIVFLIMLLAFLLYLYQLRLSIMIIRNSERLCYCKFKLECVNEALKNFR